MALNLQSFTVNDTTYIAKHNSNYSAIQTQSNVMLQDVEALKAAASPGADLDYRLLSPNLITNGGFDFWQRGVSTRPDVWTIENGASNFTVERSTAQLKLNTYSCKTVNVGQITQKLQDVIIDSFASTFSISFGAWVYATAASKARVGIYNGTTTQWSDYHTGAAGWEMLSNTFVHGAGDTPSEIKFVLDNGGSTVYFNSIVCIRGNLSATPLFIANSTTLEELRVFGYIETGQETVNGVGRLTAGTLDRELTTRVRFIAPKISIPTVTLEDDETGYDLAAENITRNGFDLIVADLAGASGTNGFEYSDIEWTATI